jgi:F0F1-type ATP synthase membrane subunit b/b'
MLDFPPDWTFVLQFFSFFALLVVLDRVLFRPFVTVLDQRDASTHGAVETAEADRATASDLRDRFDAGLADAKVAAHKQAEVIRRETQTRETAVFEQAKADVSAHLGALHTALEREATSARESLRTEVQALADAMVSTVLGRKV